MASSTPVKTDSVAVLTHQAATHPVTIVGSAINCLTKRGATLFLYHGYVEATADTNPGKFKVQVRPDAGDGTVNENWVTVAEFSSKGTTPDTEAMTATEPIGETSMAVSATAGFAAEDILYIQNATLANSEWSECQEVVTDTAILLLSGLTRQQTNTSVLWNDGSAYAFYLDLNAIESFRVVWSHEGTTGANGHVKALAITYDSDTIA